MIGFLNIYKPKGITSHDVVNRLRKILNIKKIGHAGTLDPLAEGVLPVAISYATKLIDYLPKEKEYVADFQLGVVSPSYDSESEISQYSDLKISESVLKIELKNFEGEIVQKPPIYSAVKVNGKKLYQMARNGNVDVEIPERTIFVSKIELLNFDEMNRTGRILISCSKGTYIRSIINDLGLNLKTGAIMTNLIRTKSGGMDIEDAMKLDDITSIDDINLIAIEKPFNFKCIDISESEFKKVKNGNSIETGLNCEENCFLKFDGKIAAFAEICHNIIKIKKVFLS